MFSNVASALYCQLIVQMKKDYSIQPLATLLLKWKDFLFPILKLHKDSVQFSHTFRPYTGQMH